MVSTKFRSICCRGGFYFFFSLFSFLTHTCTDCFSSVRSASIVPCRRRKVSDIGEENATDLLSRRTLGRRTIVDRILNTDTCRSHVSFSLCFYDSSLSLSFRYSPTRLLFLSLSLSLPLPFPFSPAAYLVPL